MRDRTYIVRRAGAMLMLALLPFASAGAATTPLDFVRKDVQRRGPGTDRIRWGALARDRGDLRRLWDRYEQEGRAPRVRFRRNVAVLAGTGGSGSCRTRLHDLRLDREHGRVIVRVYTEDPGEGAGCTDDWVPYTFTVAVARRDLKPLRLGELNVRARRIADPDS